MRALFYYKKRHIHKQVISFLLYKGTMRLTCFSSSKAIITLARSQKMSAKPLPAAHSIPGAALFVCFKGLFSAVFIKRRIAGVEIL